MRSSAASKCDTFLEYRVVKRLCSVVLFACCRGDPIEGQGGTPFLQLLARVFQLTTYIPRPYMNTSMHTQSTLLAIVVMPLSSRLYVADRLYITV